MDRSQLRNHRKTWIVLALCATCLDAWLSLGRGHDAAQPPVASVTEPTTHTDELEAPDDLALDTRASRTLPSLRWRRNDSVRDLPPLSPDQGAAGSGEVGTLPASFGGTTSDAATSPAVSPARFQAETIATPNGREERISALFDDAALLPALLDVECRQTLCRLEVDLTTLQRDDDAFRNLASTLMHSPHALSLEDQKAIVVIAATAVGG